MPRPLVAGLLASAILAAAPAAPAAPAGIIFDFNDLGADALDGGLSLNLTAGGITATVTANQGALAAGRRDTFGVDISGGTGDTFLHAASAPGSPGGSRTGEADAISLAFDQDVIFDAISLNAFTSTSTSGSEGPDTAFLQIGSAAPITLTAVPGSLGEFSAMFADSNFVAAGESVVLTAGSSGSFSFDSFTVSSVAAVPEPGAWALVGIAVAAGGLRLRRRQATAPA
ncbi:PEP-CTERM sorting domain-containing protein [Alienimonas sp. DA493]|uniref:PEP-CTERM sorting domain-containing protein n=1 Tax=Alienimonas sp. DA493 TaxID=3373605 RepID=UPI00375507BA